MSVSETFVRYRRTLSEEPLAIGVILVALWMVWSLVTGLASGGIQISSLASLVWDGLLRGLIIGLAGIGLSMTYSILNFANFAHGDYLTSGAFAGMGASYLIAGIGENSVGALLLVGAGGSVFGGALGIGVTTAPIAVVLGALVAGVAAIVLALAIDRFVYRPIRDESGIALLITSIGVAFALRYLLQFVYGAGVRGTTAAGSVPRINVPAIDGTFRVTAHDISLIVVAAGLMLGVHLLLQRTKLGKAMRAMSDNEDLARITGIPTEQVIRTTWIVGAGLTGVAGYMFVLWKGTLGFNDGWLLLLLVFAAVILGGIGSIYGAIGGGIIIGLTASVSVIWIPSEFGRAAAFMVMIVILLFKPEGIFSGRTTA
ncbi:branched-chain amino acid ABC transporter permease [Halorubrum sp. GN11_10-6_MGM]|uniref:branched-chain amino acid ABC transporter permease n=1 Tax=Halorubrum sp. GN11_10-6_MGM TaxID=2518112 RepID=UPI0010F9E6A6|nr:branched-chain amino acid ABC transporter permease [Halorubrum sp. GN11_10-6_MGM]TKX73631.1 branched-chain amino acid ABC transporter permease [Halorubrum sp. GN11_10-6_MGM]